MNSSRGAASGIGELWYKGMYSDDPRPPTSSGERWQLMQTYSSADINGVIKKYP